jgi:hypothetical protein
MESRSIVDQLFKICLTAGHLPSPEAYAECFQLRFWVIHESCPKVAYGAVSVFVNI